MSRSSEIRSQRYKAAKAREQQMLLIQKQQDLFAASNVRDDDDEDKEAATTKAVNPENVLDLNDPNEFFNIAPLLVSAIKASSYFKSRCSKIQNFNELVDEIYLEVTHLDPYEADSHTVRTKQASKAFCLLYRALEMNLTKKQMKALLAHQDSPFIRAIGALYLRYVGVPAQLWEWLEPLFFDEEEFSPEPSKRMTLAQWMRSLLQVRYRDTTLPRIPVLIEKQINEKLSSTAPTASSSGIHTKELPSSSSVRSKAEDMDQRKSRPATKNESLKPGQVCRAVYWEDQKWYDVRVEESGSKEGTWWLTYLPEEEYGNQEEVGWEDIRVFTDISSHQASEDDSARIKRVRTEQVVHSTTPSVLPRYDEL